MPIVQISMLAGRPVELREKLADAVTQAVCATLLAPADTVRVLITEIVPENWSVGGLSKREGRTST
jgi:4-oxalocrotonate tautomerase